MVTGPPSRFGAGAGEWFHIKEFRMTRAFSRLAPLVLCTVLLSGCGGGGHGGTPLSSPSPVAPPISSAPGPVAPTPAPAAVGTVAFAVQWPAYAAPSGFSSPKLVPAAAQSIKIVLFDARGGQLAEKVGRRPAPGVNSGSVSISNVPVGDVRVTATAYPNADGTGTAQASGTVTVTVAANQTVSKTLTMGTTIDHVSISPQNPKVTPGGTTTLTATAYNKSGAIVLTGSAGFKWDLGSSEVVFAATGNTTTVKGATVAVKGVRQGSAQVTLTELETGKQDTTRVGVTGLPARISVAPSTANLAVGQKATLKATVYDKLGIVLPDVPVTWKANDPSIVQVTANGNPATLTGLSAGRTQVNAQAGALSYPVDVSVASTVTRVVLTPANPIVQVGQTVILTATAYDKNNQPVAGRFQWTPPASDLAQFSATGNKATLKALQPSYFTVTVKELGSKLTGSTGISVAAPIDHVTITPTNPTVAVGDTVTLTAKAFDKANNPVPTNGSQWTWTPPNSTVIQAAFSGSVATVRGLAAGAAGLSVKETLSGKTASTRVTVAFVSDPLANTAWPCYRGDLFNSGRGQGGSGATGTLKWQRALPGLVGVGATCAIGPDGTLYEVGGDAVLYALNKSTGAVLWSFDLGDLAGQAFDGPVSSPAVSKGNVIFVGGAGGDLYAIDGKTHRQKWHYVNGSQFYAAASPTIGPDGTVYYAPSAHSSLFAFNPATGAKRWTFGARSSINSTPALGPDGTLYLGSVDGAFYAVSSINGAQLWLYETGTPFQEGIENSAAISPDGTVYFGTHDSSGGKVFALNGATGAKRWVFSGKSFFSSPAIAPDGTVFIGSKSGGLYALNGATGAQKWLADTGKSNSSPVYGSDGRVYVTTFGGLTAFSASNGAVLWTAPFSSDATPSAALDKDGTLYVGNGVFNKPGFLYAIH